MATLTRDYEMMQANYESLLKKRIDAKMAENLETKQQGEQFRMVDAPNVPERPFKPNLVMLFAVSLLLGLGTGIGLTYLLEYMDRSFKDEADLEHYLGMKVLAMLPLVKTAEQVRREQRRRRLAAYGVAATLIVYTGALALAYWRGFTLRLPFLA